MMTINRKVAITLLLFVLPAGAAERAEKETVVQTKPEGISKEQADAILNELRQIRLLLEKQQQNPQTAAPAAAPVFENTKSSAAGYSLGRSDAPVTLVEFTDYQCGFCKQFHTTVFEQLKKNYIDTGKLRFVSRDLPLDIHSDAFKAAEAGRCAGEQDKFWQMREALITSSGGLEQDALLSHAQHLGLAIDQFQSCVVSGKYLPEIRRDIAEANSAGIFGTPTFVLGRSSNGSIEGVKIVGAQPYAVFERVLADYGSNNLLKTK